MLHVGFYQLCQASVIDVVTLLIQKARGAGKKVLIYCPNPAASAIDDALWSHDPESWLPHGLDAAPGAELAPVWVCSDMVSNPIEADYVIDDEMFEAMMGDLAEKGKMSGDTKKEIAEILTDEEIPYFIEGVFDIGRQEIDPATGLSTVTVALKKASFMSFLKNL